MRVHFLRSIIVLSLVGYAAAVSQQPNQLSQNPWGVADTIAAVSAGAAILSMLLSIIALVLSGKASLASKKMFKRQGVIDLHMAWSGTSQIDLNKLVTPDVVKAVNALSLTAALWNHDVIEKDILYQSYWSPFKDIYETLHSSSAIVPGTNKKCRELLTSEIIRAYEDMKKVDLSKVVQTTL